MSFLNDIANYLSTPLLFGIPAWAFLIVFFLIFVNIMKNWKPKEKEYKEIDLKKEIRTDLKDRFDSFSEVIPLRYIYKLTIGYKTIGVIKRISHADWIIKKHKLKEKELLKASKGKGKLRVISKKKLKKIKKMKPSKLYKKIMIFEVFTGDGIISRIKFLANFRAKYFIVDSDLVQQQGHYYDIQNATFSSYLGINVFSKETRGYIEDVSYKLTHEDLMKHIRNFTPRAIFLQNKASLLAQKGEVLEKLIKSKKNPREGIMTDI